jgi:hypothetical protein
MYTPALPNLAPTSNVSNRATLRPQDHKGLPPVPNSLIGEKLLQLGPPLGPQNLWYLDHQV